MQSRTLLVGLIGLGACHAEASRQPSPLDPPPRYAGVTRCGAPLPPRARTDPKPQREPVPSFIAPRLDGAVTHGDVSRVIDGHASRFRGCFMKLLAHDQRAGGFRVVLRFHIRDDGEVADVEVRGVEPAMDTCLCDEVVGLHFQPLDTPTTVTFPLIFGTMI